MSYKSNKSQIHIQQPSTIYITKPSTVFVQAPSKIIVDWRNTSESNSILKSKIYVAGMWSDREYLQTKMNELKTLGYQITSNWPSFENRLVNPDDFSECSAQDVQGVLDADTILVFMTDPKYPYRGTCTEIGVAIGSGKRIIIICDGICTKRDAGPSNKSDQRMDDSFEYNFSHYCMQNVFFWDLRIEHVSSYDDAIKLLRGEKVESPYKNCYSGKISNKVFDINYN
jgi:nucleoside 2-deoxyribosyltransferase